MSCRVTGFYSYKGGVGRSMALAHCAAEMARRGRKVLIIDLDLEAPGQDCTSLFADQFHQQGGISRPGFVEFCGAYQSRMTTGLPDLQQHIVRSIQELRAGPDLPPAKGQLFLMPAGDMTQRETYRETLRQFDWNLAMGDNYAVLVHLKEEFERLGFDDVLIDSRTGDSDPFYIVALELADVLVVVSGYNRQNLLGTQSQLEWLSRYPVERQPKSIVLVFSPKPISYNKGYWSTSIRPVAPRLRDPDVELPYDLRLAMSEDLLLDELAHGRDGYAREIGRLVRAMEASPDERPAAVTPTLLNPFSVIRADYASNSELARFFVDPGEAVTRALLDFMPVHVYGNRGTGKTSLAKHYSYETSLERLGRVPTSGDMPERIGLYFRFDIDLLNVFNTRDEALRRDFDRLFANFIDILILKKALAALQVFGGLKAWCEPGHLFKLLYREFGTEDYIVDDTLPECDQFLDFLDAHFSRIRRYLNNPSDVASPVKLQGNILMKLLVEALLADRRQSFGDRWFAVMVDEVEHFETYQQEVLNSRIKQIKKSDRVTFRYFLRHEGLRTKSTVANKEQIIQESNDFRTIKLDEGPLADQFERHVLSIANRQLMFQPQLGPLRLAESERDLGELLESLTPEQEAQRLIGKSRRTDELRRWINKHGVKATPKFFTWYETQEDAVLRRVVATILINQGKGADEVVNAFEEWTPQAQNWYHNYHRAGLFWLCRLYGTDKVYAGLNDVMLLSGQNVRYFLEYMRAIVDQWLASATSSGGIKALSLPISVEIQNDAIRARAQFYIDDLRGKPRYAEQMLNIVKRLGAIFSTTHASPRQSQFEINHFSIADLNTTSDEDLGRLLRECRMENVLLRRPGNKQKSIADDRFDDWVLHPCFGPYFNISLRRKKKLELLSSSDVRVLFQGNEADFKALLSRLQSQMKKAVGLDDQGGLFAEIAD
jgi:cellulose biosynthesis protein BcsQ